MSIVLDAAPVTLTAADAPAAARPTREQILAGLPALCAEIASGAAQRERDRVLPHEIFRRLRSTGLTWLRIPKHLGGPGGTFADQIEVTCALAAADSNIAHALRGHFGFLESIAIDPAGATSRRFVDEVLAGKLFGGAHMEVDTPRPNMIRTTLRKQGANYRLNGRKYYATGAAYADYTSFSAIDEEGKLTGVLVPADRAGVKILDDWDGMGQRLTASGGVDLDDVEVFPHEIAPRQSANPFLRRHGAPRAQLHLVACIGGIVRNVLADAIDYVQHQARSAKHSASETARGDHFVQNTVGEIATASHTIDTLIADTARRMDVAALALAAGDRSEQELDELLLSNQLAQAKTQIAVGRLAARAAEQLFDTGGGSATSRQRNYDRHWRNVRTILNHNPLLLKGRVIGDYLLNGERADFDEGRVF